jgi:hypothetical protein
MSFLRGKDKTPFKPMRHYARLNTAIPRAVMILLDEGKPGDVLELAHSEHGFQIATITIHVGGLFKIKLSEDLTT